MALASKPLVAPVAQQARVVAPSVMRPANAPRRVRAVQAQAQVALAKAASTAVATANGAPAPAVVEDVDIAKHMADRHAQVIR
jgi:hypothetical protein